MRSSDQRQAVVVIERLTNILAKGIPRSSRANTPSTPIIRITPEQITHGALMRHLLNPIERADIVERVDAGRQAAVQTEDLVVDERGQGQVVEQVGKVLPHVGVAVLAQAFVVEAVDLRDLARLVVAAQDGDALGVADFERDEKRHRLDGEVASVDVVALDLSVFRCIWECVVCRLTHEEVVGVGIRATDLEQLHQVVELSMYITTDCDWTSLQP